MENSNEIMGNYRNVIFNVIRILYNFSLCRSIYEGHSLTSGNWFWSKILWCRKLSMYVSKCAAWYINAPLYMVKQQSSLIYATMPVQAVM